MVTNPCTPKNESMEPLEFSRVTPITPEKARCNYNLSIVLNCNIHRRSVRLKDFNSIHTKCAVNTPVCIKPCDERSVTAFTGNHNFAV